MSMITNRRIFLQSCALSLTSFGSCLPSVANTQSSSFFHSRAVEFVYTVPPGSALDAFFRRSVDLVANFLPRGAFFSNRPGGNSLVGTRYVLRADGNPKVLVSSSTPIILNPLLNNDLGYDPFKDFYHEFLLLRQPMFLVCNPKTATNFKELILSGKSAKGLKSSSTGIGGLLDLKSRLIERHFDLKIIHAPYTSNFILPVLSHEVDFTWVTANQSVLPFLQTGKLVPIVTTGTHRHQLYPHIPTLGEFIPNYQSNVFFGFSVPLSSQGEIQTLEAAGVDWAHVHKTLRKDFHGQGYDFDSLNVALKYKKILIDESRQWKDILKRYSLTSS